MKIFCETVFSEMLPALRSIVAHELITTYKLSQDDVAKKLGITQPAVSQYKAGVRGKKMQVLMSDKQFMEFVGKLSAEIAAGNVNIYEKVCDICKETRRGEMDESFLCLIEMNKKVSK